jgi:hypothetical protein
MFKQISVYRGVVAECRPGGVLVGTSVPANGAAQSGVGGDTAMRAGCMLLYFIHLANCMLMVTETEA